MSVGEDEHTCTGNRVVDEVARTVHALDEKVHREVLHRAGQSSGGTWLSPELHDRTAPSDPPSGRVPRPAVAVLHALLWAALHASAVLSGWLTVPEDGRLLFWPAAGFGALWIQQTPRRHLAPNVALLLTTTTVIDLLLGLEPVPAVAYAVTSLAMACTTRWVLSRSGTVVMSSTRGVIALARGAATAGLVGAPLGVLSVYLATGHASWFEAFTWLVRSTTGIFVVVGLALAVVATRHARRQGVAWSDLVTTEPRQHWAAELAVTVVVTVAALVVVFDDQDGVALAFVLVAVAAYVGFRFAPVVASVYITASGTVAIVATLADRGPFSSIIEPDMRALAVRVFVLVQAAIALTLSWAIRERHELTVRLRAAQRDAHDRAQLLDAVTNRLEHGVAVLDGRGRVVVRNDAAARLIPVPLDELGEPFDPARYGIHGPDGELLDIFDMEHAKALTAGESVTTSVVVRSAGSETYLRVRIDPLELREGSVRRLAVVSMRDDTSHRQRIKDLEAFTGVIAHDLRNPLAALSTWTEVLADHLDDKGAHDDQTREALHRITVTGERMGRLVSDLLAYATASSAPLDLADVSLRQLVDDVTAETAAATGRTPDVTVTGDDTLRADPVLARQVLANVIGNAVKYTADGQQPVIRVTAHHDAERGTVVVDVTDNGVGVPAHMRDAVFDGFTRVKATAQSRPGAGLGLAICARAMQRHDGTIALTAGPGGTGSTVTMTFPAPPQR